MRGRGLAVLMSGMVWYWAPAVGQTPATGSISGKVVDSLKRPLQGAELTIASSRHRAVTDSLGRFALPGLLPGITVVQAKLFGYRSLFFQIEVEAGQDKAGLIGLEREPTQLPEITVIGKNGKPAKYSKTMKFDEYFRRKLEMKGVFLSREDIERTHPQYFLEVLTFVPGVRVSVGAAGALGQTSAIFPRCNTPPKVAVYIDGKRVGSPGKLDDEVNSIDPNDVELVEIYRGVSEIPPEFQDNDSCAVVAVWLRYH